MEFWLAAFARVTGRPGSRNDPAMLDLSKIAEDPDQGLAEIEARLPHFEAHHQAGSWGAEAFDLGSFTRHFGRWAAAPKGPKAGSKEESSSDVARRISKVFMDTLVPQVPALPEKDPNGNP